jgi:2-oxoglutarate dehydrogenase E2 component (dihydrolipoamide succinyltransferase)
MVGERQHGGKGYSLVRGFATRVVKVPTMGDSISNGVVEEFVKKPGDYVEADEIIAKIETDKVTVDIPAPVSGVIK